MSATYMNAETRAALHNKLDALIDATPDARGLICVCTTFTADTCMSMVATMGRLCEQDVISSTVKTGAAMLHTLQKSDLSHFEGREQ